MLKMQKLGFFGETHLPLSKIFTMSQCLLTFAVESTHPVAHVRGVVKEFAHFFHVKGVT